MTPPPPDVPLPTRWRHAVVALVFVCAALWGGASLAATPLTDRFIETWSTRDGVPHSSINDVVQTPDGHLWLGTWEGLARYDGREFQVYRRDDVPGLLDDSVRALMVARDGALWAGSVRGGIARLQAGRWRAMAPVDAMVKEFLHAPDGRIWVATTTDGLYRLDPDGRRAHIGLPQGLPSETVNALAVDARGRVWAGTSRGLVEIGGTAARPMSTVRAFHDSNVYALAQAADGSLLVGTEHGAWRLRGGRVAPLHPALRSEAVIDLDLDADGALWLGTIDAGLARLQDGRVEWLGVDDGLPNSRVLSLLRDREGSLWVGTNGGLSRLREAPIRTFGRAQGLPDDFARTVLARSGGGVWAGTAKGLATIDAGGHVAAIAAGTPLASESILALAPAQGGVWIGTFKHGLLRWNGARVVERITRSEGLPSNEIRVVLPARDGSLWIGTAHGLVRWTGRVAGRWGGADGLPSDFIVALHEADDGAIWVGTGAGAARLREGRVEPVDLRTADAAEYVFGFMPGSAGATWLATDRGLVRAGADGLRLVQRRHGLPFDKIFAALRDRDGAVWLTGNRGIVRVDAQALDAVADGRAARLQAELFGEGDGMASAQANGGSGPPAALGEGGFVWVATAAGIARVDPARAARRQAASAPVRIHALQADGQSWHPVEGMRLPAGVRRLQAEFAAMSFVLGDRVAYRYQLDGFSPEWVDAGRRREAQFTNLPPGAYRLRVQAVVPGGTRVLGEAALGFELLPYWWQRPAVWLATALLLLASLALAWQLRLRRLRRSEHRLRDLVDERTAALHEQTRIAEQLARTDTLTSLANRRALNEALRRAPDRSTRDDLCLLLVDIDHFKQVNDRYSHAAGDAALRAVAEVMSRSTRQHDLAARWGGEEFAMLLRDCTLERAVAAAERLRHGIAAIDCSGFAPGLRLSASIGVACGRDADSGEALISRADAALYRAKQDGRDRVRAG